MIFTSTTMLFAVAQRWSVSNFRCFGRPKYVAPRPLRRRRMKPLRKVMAKTIYNVRRDRLNNRVLRHVPLRRQTAARKNMFDDFIFLKLLNSL